MSSPISAAGGNGAWAALSPVATRLQGYAAPREHDTAERTFRCTQDDYRLPSGADAAGWRSGTAASCATVLAALSVVAPASASAPGNVMAPLSVAGLSPSIAHVLSGGQRSEDTFDDNLNAVTATGAGGVWAVGTSTLARVLAEHWDGNEWSFIQPRRLALQQCGLLWRVGGLVGRCLGGRLHELHDNGPAEFYRALGRQRMDHDAHRRPRWFDDPTAGRRCALR